MLAPTAGTIEVLGGRPAAGPAQLARVGYLPQNAPVYAALTVADHLKLGAHLNPAWDAGLARDRIGRLDLDPRQKAGTLSGGQRVQLALTLAVAKRPELLILDEPVASLDPLARREFLRGLMESVAEQGLSVVLSSHLVGDLERVCDYLIVLVASRVQVAGPVDDLLATHHLLTGPRRDPGSLPGGVQVISASHTDVQSTLLVRTCGPVLDPAWTVSEVGLEDLVLAYMSQAPETAAATATWRCRNDLADLAAVPHPGHHRGRGDGRVRGPARGHRAAPGQHLCRRRARQLPRRLRERGRLLHRVAGHQPLPGAVPAQHRDHPPGARRHRPVLRRPADRPRAGDRNRRPGLEPVRHPDRWLAVKLAAGALAAMAVTEALSLMQTWWEAPISQAVADGGSGGALAQSRFTQLNFATHGITPLGYAAFAFALGVTAGALILRALPAMALTLAIFATLQVAMPLWVRPNLAPPDHTVLPVTALGAALASPGPGGTTYTLLATRIPGQPGAWILSSGPVNAAGQGDQHYPGGLHSASERQRGHGRGHGHAGRPQCTELAGRPH